MLKKKEQEPESNNDITHWLEKISSQLERLIICQEKKLSGQVFNNFDSKKLLEKEV